jgi:hypothetical protein
MYTYTCNGKTQVWSILSHDISLNNPTQLPLLPLSTIAVVGLSPTPAGRRRPNPSPPWLLSLCSRPSSSATPPPTPCFHAALRLASSSTRLFLTPATRPPMARLRTALLLVPPLRGFSPCQLRFPLRCIFARCSAWRRPCAAFTHATPYSAVMYNNLQGVSTYSTASYVAPPVSVQIWAPSLPPRSGFLTVAPPPTSPRTLVSFTLFLHILFIIIALLETAPPFLSPPPAMPLSLLCI